VRYGIWLAALSSAPDISIGDEMVGYAETYLPWQPPDIPGTVSMVKGEVGVGSVASAEGGFLHIYGSEIFPPMQVIFGEAGLKDPLDEPPSRSLKDLIPVPQLGGFWGKIQSKSFPDIDYTAVHVKTDHAVAYKLSEDVHFCLDGALLTEDARQALRIMCANELAALMSPASHLAIIGHTDRSDTDQRNLTLSAMRAENTYQAIQDILGSRLAIPERQIVRSGKGETEAIRDQRPDGERNPKYRRVDVILNGRLVLTLKAE
jgi:outer membrane protein OmpA-like peptidoglycan-associated protein